MTPIPAQVQGTGADCWIRLADGRRLAFAQYGDPNGKPVLMFHGLPGSRLSYEGAGEPHPDGRRLRVIAPDRPGIGRSDPQPGRTIRHWPADVSALADALGIDRFAVLGGSAGGVYALACGAALPGRVRCAVVINTPAPMHWPGVWRAHPLSARLAWYGIGHVAGLPRFVAGFQRQAALRGNLLVRLLGQRMAPADRALLAERGISDQLVRHFREAYRQGAAGVAHDLRLIASPWGFEPRDVTVPVALWQGLRDRNVPPAMGRALAAALPRCAAHFVAGEGHLAGELYGEIRAVLLDTRPAGRPQDPWSGTSTTTVPAGSSVMDTLS